MAETWRSAKMRLARLTDEHRARLLALSRDLGWCSHPDTEAVEAALAEVDALRAIARRLINAEGDTVTTEDVEAAEAALAGELTGREQAKLDEMMAANQEAVEHAEQMGRDAELRFVVSWLRAMPWREAYCHTLADELEGGDHKVKRDG